MTVYLNGHYLAAREAAIPINDRGLIFGDGLFTTLRVHQGLLENAESHLQRITDQCKELNIIPPYIPLSVLEHLVVLNHAQVNTWRMKIIVTGGNSTALHLPQRDAGAVLITLDPYAPPINPYRLCMYPYPTHRSHVKSLSYLHRLQIKQYALERGYDDAIATTAEGYLLECAFSNIFWKIEAKIYTPDPVLPLLSGIFLSTLTTIKVQMKLSEISKEAEFFICNSLIHSHPIESIAS